MKVFPRLTDKTHSLFTATSRDQWDPPWVAIPPTQAWTRTKWVATVELALWVCTSKPRDKTLNLSIMCLTTSMPESPMRLLWWNRDPQPQSEWQRRVTASTRMEVCRTWATLGVTSSSAKDRCSTTEVRNWTRCLKCSRHCNQVWTIMTKFN